MKTGMLLTAIVAAVATVASAQPNDRGHRWNTPESLRGARDRGGDELVLYQDVYFSGRPVRLDGPEPDLRRLGFNDAASSFRASGAWEVCEDINFGGRCRQVSGAEANLVQAGYNDRISSARPVNIGGGDYDRRNGGGFQGPINRREGAVTLFEHAGFGGRAVPINGEEPDLNRLGFNDVASSVRVARGAWRLCSDANFQGTCVIVSSDLANLNDLRLNDRVSSIQRIQ